MQGLPYGTYLVVETTVPHDLFQAEPFIVTVDPEQDNNPWGAMATPKDSVMTGSDSYQKFTVLDEEIEVYLRITKIDEETGKPVLLPDTAFQIYWLDEQGHYRYDSNGNPKLVTMTDTVNGHLTKDVNTFHTNGEGILTLPEKLPLGKYRIVEVTGPNGFYNEWLDSAGYENGVLADDADGSYYVDFEITTDRIYAATGDKNENGMDAEVQIQQLARQRKVLYRQKREPERAAREEKIKSLTQQMKALRHEVYICSDIETDAAEVQEKLRQAELAAQEERNEVKQDEQRRRSSRSDGAGSLTGYRSSH